MSSLNANPLTIALYEYIVYKTREQKHLDHYPLLIHSQLFQPPSTYLGMYSSFLFYFTLQTRLLFTFPSLSLSYSAFLNTCYFVTQLSIFTTCPTTRNAMYAELLQKHSCYLFTSLLVFFWNRIFIIFDWYYDVQNIYG